MANQFSYKNNFKLSSIKPTGTVSMVGHGADMTKSVYGPWLHCVNCGKTIHWSINGHGDPVWFHTTGMLGCGIIGLHADPPELWQRRLI